jgi:probable FeS assembly SUF system protein SufT
VNDAPFVELTRDCRATTVPDGETVVLDRGGRVAIVQRLGTSITVRTEMGLLLRIDGDDADALGLPPPTAATDGGVGDDGPRAGGGVGDAPFSIDRVLEVLDGIYDPEIPVSIVALGLVYRCEAFDRPDGTRRVEIDMSMTAPGCGMGDVLRADAERAVRAVPGVDDVEVNLVWQPRWTVHRMSEAARLQLGML